jgi:hypothetical protein
MRGIKQRVGFDNNSSHSIQQQALSCFVRTDGQKVSITIRENEFAVPEYTATFKNKTHAAKVLGRAFYNIELFHLVEFCGFHRNTPYQLSTNHFSFVDLDTKNYDVAEYVNGLIDQGAKPF